MKKWYKVFFVLEDRTKIRVYQYDPLQIRVGERIYLDEKHYIVVEILHIFNFLNVIDEPKSNAEAEETLIQLQELKKRIQ